MKRALLAAAGLLLLLEGTRRSYGVDSAWFPLLRVGIKGWARGLVLLMLLLLLGGIQQAQGPLMDFFLGRPVVAVPLHGSTVEMRWRG